MAPRVWVKENRMQDYKDTLHLPETEFAMKADLAKREPDWLKTWEAQKPFLATEAARTGKPKFILHDGPPYANGTLHIGHAANKILKDIICKAARLRGMDAPFVPGWDCHGLPIELVIEKKYGRVGQKLNAAEFRAKCREYAAEQIHLQREDLKRLGVIANWDHPYFTMNFAYEADIIRTLAKIYEKGHIKKGQKPVHWCLDCSSSLAEAEVEYKDKESDSVYVRFAVAEGAKSPPPMRRRARVEGASVLIWTTTPWTLPANMAVCAGADIIYVLVRVGDERFFVAKDLVESVFKDQPIEILESYTGKELAGLKLKHCFEDREVSIIVGAHVTTDAGTGFVHTAPAHGADDYQVWLGEGHASQDILNPVMSNGCFAADTPYFAGLHVSKVNPKVIELLSQKGALLRHEKIKHSFPHCWRHKTPLIFRATPQWFISMDALINPALRAAEQVQFVPPEGRNRFVSMLEGRPDWCISRQRTWGVPLPLFTHKETGEPHPDTFALLAKVANRIEKDGLEAWFGASAEDFGVDPAVYDKGTDTLDVWFESGSSNQCVLKKRPELQYPADLYLEGSDQHRAWFQASLLVAMAATGEAPYKQILTHGFLVDGQGRKMSKSLGNIVTIQEGTAQYGADILRLWVAMSDYTGEISYSNTIMGPVTDLYRKVRNTLRYLLSALHEFDMTKQGLPISELIELDQFMMAKAFEVQKEVDGLLSAKGDYAIRAAMSRIREFCEDDLSNVYFDVLKDRLYTENDWNRESAQTALYYILNILVRLISPILSFTADEVWQLMRQKGWASSADETVFTTEFLPSTLTLLREGGGESKKASTKSPSPPVGEGWGGGEPWHDHWPRLKSLRAELNKTLDQLRKNGEIGSNLDVNVSFADKKMEAWFRELAASGELKYFFIVSDCKIGEESIQKSPHPKCARCWHHREDVTVRVDLVDDASQAICDRCYDNLTGKGIRRRYF